MVCCPRRLSGFIEEALEKLEVAVGPAERSDQEASGIGAH